MTSNCNLEVHPRFSRYFPQITKNSQVNELKSAKVVPPYPLMSKTTMNWLPSGSVLENGKSRIRKSSNVRKLSGDDTTNISLNH